MAKEKLGRRGLEDSLVKGQLYSAHPQVSSLNFIELIFLPPNNYTHVAQKGERA